MTYVGPSFGNPSHHCLYWWCLKVDYKGTNRDYIKWCFRKKKKKRSKYIHGKKYCIRYTWVWVKLKRVMYCQAQLEDGLSVWLHWSWRLQPKLKLRKVWLGLFTSNQMQELLLCYLEVNTTIWNWIRAKHHIANGSGAHCAIFSTTTISKGAPILFKDTWDSYGIK